VVIAQAILLSRFWVARPEKKVPRRGVPAQIKGRIAIVVDDWGYNLNNVAALKQIRYPLTLAVLPNLGYSKEVSRQAHALGFEIILHLPMEPSEKRRLENNTIMISMEENAIDKILSEDLDAILYAKGVSNHMGSGATKDVRTMTFLFKELKRKGLYFLDSYVSSDSICYDLSRQMRLGFAKRDVFIDNTLEPEYIKAQINKLKTKARFYGQAIGIGHDRRSTLQVLEEVMPQLEKEGYKFVYVSELVH
jgi:polysaccharide deacetylase 2 family uncharacterized protein YibQ